MKHNLLIVLTGFMGSGKSALGSMVAGKLGIMFYDLDNEIEKGENAHITEIFRSRCEQHFRSLEVSYLKQLINCKPMVLALGGGAFAQPEIRETIKKHGGITVYLEVPVSTLFERLKRKSNRPLLLDENGRLPDDHRLMQRIKKLHSRREPVYRKANLIIPVQPDWTHEQTTDQILKRLSEHERTIRPEHQ